MLDKIYVILLSVTAALIATYAQYKFKRALNKFNLNLKEIFQVLKKRDMQKGGILYVASLAVYLVALSSGDLSFVYPTFASTFVFVAFTSHKHLNENLQWDRILGVVLIIAGIVAISFT